VKVASVSDNPKAFLTFPSTVKVRSPVFLSSKTKRLSTIVAVILEFFVSLLIFVAMSFKLSKESISKVNSFAIPF
jgi:hypothetical protein